MQLSNTFFTNTNNLKSNYIMYLKTIVQVLIWRDFNDKMLPFSKAIGVSNSTIWNLFNQPHPTIKREQVDKLITHYPEIVPLLNQHKSIGEIVKVLLHDDQDAFLNQSDNNNAQLGFELAKKAIMHELENCDTMESMKNIARYANFAIKLSEDTTFEK